MYVCDCVSLLVQSGVTAYVVILLGHAHVGSLTPFVIIHRPVPLPGHGPSHRVPHHFHTDMTVACLHSFAHRFGFVQSACTLHTYLSHALPWPPLARLTTDA